jgi:hypothetical protein
LHLTTVSNATIDSFVMIANDGGLYSDVECLCGVAVGRYHLATTPQFDHLRFMFTLQNNSIYSYTTTTTTRTTTTTTSLLHTALNQITLIPQTTSLIAKLLIANDDLDLMSASLTTTTTTTTTTKPTQPQLEQPGSPSHSFSDDLELRFDS